MDKEILVDEATDLVRHLDNVEIKPKAAMLVVSEETGNWKLWIIPKDESMNKLEFYRIIADVISKNDLREIDLASIKLASSKNPAMAGMGKMLHMEELGKVEVSNNTYNGVLLPDGVVLRMDI